MKKYQVEGRINFVYNGRESKYSLSDLQTLLPFHGAMAALLRVVLDDIIDAAHASGNPTRYIASLIARRSSYNKVSEPETDGQLEKLASVDS